jgi:UPF0176 protein
MPDSTSESFPFAVTAFYRFAMLNSDEVEKLRIELQHFGESLHLRGLVLLGVEGVNGTVSGKPDSIDLWENKIRSMTHFHDIYFKRSVCAKIPFRHWKIQIRDEIVTIGDLSIHPTERHNRHLTPAEWDRLLHENRDQIVVVDTRNTYETEIGKFKGAIIPEISDFKDFPEWVAHHPLPKDKKILIYCTGGIRCEKAIYAMEREGYTDVAQLEGGILNYLKEKPDAQFEGECFVFDRRVAVQQDLLPSVKYQTCPHCGQSAAEVVTCDRCDSSGPMCQKCSESLGFVACSKNCAYHLELNPKAKGRPQHL